MSMGMFNSSKPNDVLFLQPVRYAREKMPRNKVRMLYCDASGKLYASVMSRSVYELARRNAASRGGTRMPFATVGLETVPGRFIATAVTISDESAWALDRILEHALSSGTMPDILKKYVKPIIERGSVGREAIIAGRKKRRKETPVPVVPKVLNRLPYYPERDIEISMPIYKASYRYPLVVLKRLQPDAQTTAQEQRLLILDSDGDMAVIKAPRPLIRKMDLELASEEKKNGRPTRALIMKNGEYMNVEYLPVSQEQYKSLETLTRYYEQTGNSKSRVSNAVQTMLTRAKDALAGPD
ncbi:MAG: hypothetical protein MUO19_08820 [Dehalococcoidales bacterium]|nr:hypothetical protein [Dehalococcoidales bacterium]